MKHTMGIIGFGGMGNHHYKHVTQEIDRLTVKGVYDIKDERAQYARSLGMQAYGSAEELLNDGEIDLVLVATPNNWHKHYVEAALRAGKNVICEKPVMMNSEELEQVMETAKQCGKVFTVHQNRRWDRDYLLVKRELESGTLGKPFFIESRVEGARGIPGDWRCTKVAGGGMMLDWGVHLIDQMLMMIDSPVSEIYAQVLNVKYQNPENDVDDNLKINMKFKNGVCAMIEVGTYNMLTMPRWYVCGDKGTMKIDDWGSGADIVYAKDVEMVWENSIIYTAAGPTRTMAPRPKETVEEKHVDIDEKKSVYLFYENVLDTIEGKAELIVKPEEAMRSMKVMEAAFKSSAEGICVKEEI